MVLLLRSTHSLFFFSLLLLTIITLQSTYPISISACLPRERKALLDFKHYAISQDFAADFWLSSWVTDPPLTTNSSSFDSSHHLDCCKWNGVTCDAQGMVTDIDLSNCFHNNTVKLRAHMNAEALRALADIHHLSILDFSCQRFYGSIAAEIGNLTSLTQLRLPENNLTGHFPASMQHLTSLNDLDLSNNQFPPQEIPSFLLELPLLETLNLSYNSFRGALPDAFTNVSIEFLLLDLSHNNLDGHLPLSMKDLMSLMYLDLKHNLFSPQPIPFNLLQLPSLHLLDLSHNSFTGAIPDAFTKLNDIEFLDLSNNQLDGPLPPSMGYLRNLKLLFLSNNLFDGPLPPFIQNLTSLKDLELSYNLLSGHLPQWIKYLTSLKLFDIGNNRFSLQQIPSSLLELPSLKYLVLSSNKFLGAIPNSFPSVAPIVYLDLSQNQLDGPLPPSMRYLRFLMFLNISSNRFSPQAIPSTLLHLPSLVGLDLSFNNFTGIDSFSSKSMNDASLHGFKSQLQYLNLAYNNLNDSIFDSDGVSIFQYLKKLIVLDLRYNQLQGLSFPQSSSLLNPELLILIMHCNRLQGPIPSFIRYLTRLKVLDLGSNELSGNIPEWIGSSLSLDLRVLILAGNQLAGTIPSSLGQLRAMQNIDSSFNKTELEFVNGSTSSSFDISLDIPINLKGQTRSFLDVPSLSALDLSDNQLSGRIPPELGMLKGLVSLNLSGNVLEGQIPGTLGDLRNLESLDLSRNKLQGPIPDSFNNLQGLGFVNLSRNHLNGSIPWSPQWDTFNDSSFLDNDGLCSKDGKSLARLPLCGYRSTTLGYKPSLQLKDIDGFLKDIVEWGGFAIGYPVGVLSGLLLASYCSGSN